MKSTVTNNFTHILQDTFTPYYASAPCPLTEADIYTAAFNEEERHALDVMLKRNKGIVDHVPLAKFQLGGMPADKFHGPIEFDFKGTLPLPRDWWSGSRGNSCIPASHPCHSEAVVWLSKVVQINKEIFLMRELAYELAAKCANMMQLAKVWPELKPFMMKMSMSNPRVYSELCTQLRYLRDASAANISNSRPQRLTADQATLIIAARPVLAKIHLLSNDKSIKARQSMKVRVGSF